MRSEGISETLYSSGNSVRFIDSIWEFFSISEISKVRKAQAIHFSSLFFPPTLPILIGAIWFKKSIIISPRGELYPSALAIKPFQKKIWLLFIKVFQHKIFFHASNEFEKTIIKNHFLRTDDIKVIPNFIELPIKLNEKVNRNQLLFIGRVNPIKNIDVLLNSIAEIKNSSNPHIKLLIAGEARLDYEKEYFKELIKIIFKLDIESNVSFLGHIEYNEKQKILASSFALILPSKSENFGNVVIEALAQGTPVIASKNTPWEILEETNSGYWVSADSEDISETISKLMNMDWDDYLRMRQNAYQLCLEKFDVKTNIHRWENYYHTISSQ